MFGGILARRENESDQTQMNEFEIPYFDLVIVDLYPFEATVASGAPEQDIIEKIDIGGISLIVPQPRTSRIAGSFQIWDSTTMQLQFWIARKEQPLR